MQQSASSSSSSSSSSDDEENVMISQKWRVSPDYGELDDHIMSREQDIASGKKESGWSNPLSWSDTGNDDDQVVLQTHANIRYAVSEGPTKADNSEADETVLPRTLDADGKWENPLSWHDAGEDDERIL